VVTQVQGGQISDYLDQLVGEQEIDQETDLQLEEANQKKPNAESLGL
jgi:hypothetical protein